MPSFNPDGLPGLTPLSDNTRCQKEESGNKVFQEHELPPG